MSKRKKIDLYFILFSLLILLLLIFPFFEIGNKVYPLVFGIPFSLFWIVSCIIFQFFGIVIFLFLDKEE